MTTETPWGDTPCTPGDEEWERRFAWFMAQPTEGWWWCSFVDTDRPEGDRFLGVCIVPGGNIVQATQTAWDLGINPGGEVAAWPLSAKPFDHLICKLFTGDEGRALGNEPLWEDHDDG